MILNVRDLGAVGDGKTLDTDAINRAIAAAEPGSVVVLRAGTYLSYSIRLRSNVTLHLDRGATLLAAGAEPPPLEEIRALLTEEGILPGAGKGDGGAFYPARFWTGRSAVRKRFTPPTEKKRWIEDRHARPGTGTPDYDPPEHNPHARYQDHGHSHWHNALIWGEQLENVAVTGEGTIDGRGLAWNADPERPTGDKAIALKNCRNVRVTDVTIFRGGHFAVLASGC